MKYCIYFLCLIIYSTNALTIKPESLSLPKPSTPRRLLGAKECTWGPSYWCSNITAAAKCNAVKHCIQTVWVHQTLPADTDSVCEICLDMVKQARDQLLSNETEEEIKEVFEGSCKLIPIKIVNQECCKLVDNFIPELVDTLASQMNPQVVCSVAGLCNSARIDSLIADYEKEKAVSAPNACDNCHTVVDVLEKRFGKMSQDEVLQSFLRICGQMSSLSDACSNIVVTYFNKIYVRLQDEFNSDNVCMLAGECSALFHTHAVEITPLSKVGFVPVGQENDDLPCDLCEQLVNHLRDLLVANTTEIEFKKVLEGLCNQTAQFRSECTSLVDEYYPVVYSFLVNELNGQEICSMIGICPQKIGVENIPIVPLLPAETAPKAYDLLNDNEDDLNRVNVPNKGLSVKIMSKPETMQLPIERLFPMVPDTYNRQVCVFCQYFLHYLQNAITDPATDEEIKREVDKACKILPASINNTCIDFVDTYGDAVVALLAQEIDPSVICPLIRACPASDAEDVEVFREQNMGKSNCPLCLFAVTELEDMVKNNNTKANVRNALDKLCSHFTGSIAVECQDFVDTYADTLIDKIVEELPAQDVCVYVKLCNATLPEKPLVALPEENDIDILSNEIPDDTVNGELMGRKPVDSKQFCVICEFAMDKIQKMLQNKTTEEEIKDAVLSVCDHLPKSVQSECSSFVNKYADLVIQLLISSLEPSEICSYIGLCAKKSEILEKTAIIDIPADDLQISIDSIQDLNPLAVGSPQCSLCKVIITAVEKFIVGKPTKADIINSLYDVCDELPKSDEKSCEDFVAKYGDSIADLIIAATSPGEICSILMLCDDVREMIEDEISECSLCEAVYFNFDYFTKSRGKILPEYVCNPMIKKYVKRCLNILEKHAFAMSMYSSSNEDTSIVCQELEYCKGGSPYLRIRRADYSLQMP